MGAFFSHHQHAEIVRKNQDHIGEMNRLKMERYIQLHYQIKTREKALEIAKNRELFFWITGFYIVAFSGITSRFRRLQRTTILAPLVPLTFIFAYYADLAYGSKLHRITQEAEIIMNHEPLLLEWPCDIPTVSSIDMAREEQDDESKMHPPMPIV